MQRHRSPSPPCWPPRLQSFEKPARLGSLSPISQPRSAHSPPISPAVSAQDSHSSSLMSYPELSYDASVRKRPRQASDYLSELSSALSPWECHSVYGIVHATGCNICNPYMTHMADAERQTSFQLALKDRNHKRDVYFFDGVSEGRRRQRDDDEYLFDDRERYRTERNEALEATARYRVECFESREELRVVKEKLQISEAECDRLRQRVESLARAQTKQVSEEMKMEGIEIERILDPRSSPQATDSHIVEDHSTTSHKSSKLDQPTSFPQTESTAEPSPLTPPIVTTYAAVASSQAAKWQSTISTPVHPTANLPARPGVAPPSAVSAVDLRATAAQTNGFTSGRNPKNIRQLQSLMNAAHQPGNEGALAKVKALCAEAHQTPREQKTELQRFLLSNWRNPNLPGDVSTPPLLLSKAPILSTSKTNPRMDDPVEVWYEYLSTHQGSWPRGVRRDSRNRPHLLDLKASRVVARLRPEVDPSGSITSRSEFMACVAELFSIAGLYEDRINRNEFKIAPAVSYRPYRGSSTITVDNVVRHFADCGIAITTARDELEPWAQCYQAAVPAANQAGSNTDTRHTGLNGFGRSQGNFGSSSVFSSNAIRPRYSEDRSAWQT